MSNCGGLHCDGCGKGGLSLGAVVALAVIVLAAVKHAAVAHAADVIGQVIEYTLIGIASAAGLAILAGSAMLGLRIRRRMLARSADPALASAPVKVISVTPARPALPTPDEMAAREALRAEALAWALDQIAARRGRGDAA